MLYIWNWSSTIEDYASTVFHAHICDHRMKKKTDPFFNILKSKALISINEFQRNFNEKWKIPVRYWPLHYTFFIFYVHWTLIDWLNDDSVYRRWWQKHGNVIPVNWLWMQTNELTVSDAIEMAFFSVENEVKYLQRKSKKISFLGTIQTKQRWVWVCVCCIAIVFN